MELKNLLSVALFFIASTATAQTNPKAGYIITNNNDTISGTIDFRSDTKNANECLFRADGASEFKAYTPNEILGYRLADNGVYYVKRTFPVDGKQKTFFAEYLLQGGVSLFHHTEYNKNYFYFVDEDGKVAIMKEPESEIGIGGNATKIQSRAMQEAALMLGKSTGAVQQLWVSDFNPQKLARITREYDEKFCRDAGDCVQFEYDADKAASLKIRFRVQAGVMFGTLSASYDSYYIKKDMNLKCSTPQIGVGMDLMFPRFSKCMTAQLLVAFSHIDATKDSIYKIKANNIGVQLGGVYSFLPDKCISPIIRAGMIVNERFGTKTEKMEDYYVGHVLSNSPNFGYYIGAGADFAIGKHSVRLSAEYDTYDSYGVTNKGVTVNASFLF